MSIRIGEKIKTLRKTHYENDEESVNLYKFFCEQEKTALKRITGLSSGQ